MKIAFAVVKNIARGGGVEKYTEELGERLVKKGHDVFVYSMNNYGEHFSTYKGMKILSVPSIPIRQMEKLSASQAAGLRVALNPKVDIVHYHSVSPGSTIWMAKFMGKKTVIQMHGLEWKRLRWGNLGKNVHKFLERWSLLWETNITAVSKVQCDYFKKKYNVDSKYIPGGVNIKDYTDAEEIIKLGLKPKKYILFASRLVKDKGAHYLIPAFKKLDTNYNLVVAGDVPNEDLYKKELLKLAGNDQRIIFPGFVEGRLLDELFSNAAVYVQPSEIEGLSIALLEAMSYGLPCLVSNIPENLEAIDNCGISFHNGQIDDLSKKLEDIIYNDSYNIDLSQRALDRVKKHYSWESVASEFEKYYCSLLNK